MKPGVDWWARALGLAALALVTNGRASACFVGAAICAVVVWILDVLESRKDAARG